MDFFKVKKFRKAHKPNPEKDLEDKPVPPPEEMKNENVNDLTKSAKADPTAEVEDDDDDDDDFITNEVKRRLKELRRNSFMVLIPEESCPEEEEGETSSNDWRDSEVELGSSGVDNSAQIQRFPLRGYLLVQPLYLQCMCITFRIISEVDSWSSNHPVLSVMNYDSWFQFLGSRISSIPSPRSASKKLASTLRSLSLKKREEPPDEGEHLQHLEDDPYQNLETAYVAQLCLTWEVLHCEYTQLSQEIASQPESLTCFNHAAQQFQQFQVLLQRFIENEPFEQGLRVEIYARTRNSLPKLLQVPNIQGSNQKEKEEEESDSLVLASGLIRIIENTILSFRLFLKMDKKKSTGVFNLFGGENQIVSPLQQIQSSLEKKEMKLKELCKKKKGWKKKSWPATQEEVDLLFGVIDIKVISRVLRMVRINKEQLLWCDEKMNKVNLSEGKLHRDPSPVLFPC
ncbi:hypothetical protein HHK36_026151 [Tetracentron sinense]|uniref:Uncharacterized protein n=1 Tax=Tetracentron sinense TaxID=13715 RepID=A0A834YLT7_TETSI|nr:hypothetical protein HHK36_026151 [Tetracentron sinense]